MPTYIALLRAINVGGANRVAMSDLRGLLSRMGLQEPKSLLQTGNLVFRAEGLTGSELESALERQAEAALGLRTEFLVRDATEWRALVDSNPFRDEAERDPAHLLIVVLKTAPGTSDVAALRAAIAGPERVHAHGKQLYAYYPAGIGRSRLTSTVIERNLRTRGTARNWNTVLRLAALAGAS